MFRYIISRLWQMFIILFGVTFLTFTLTYLAPSDAAQMTLSKQGTAPTEELLNATRERMGLNDPFLVQYVRWLKGVLKGDFGESLEHGNSVFSRMTARIPRTIQLTFLSTLVMAAIALPLGILSAFYKDGFWDYLIRVTSFFGIAIPDFWFGLILMLVFGVILKMFPIMSDGSLRSAILPVITLAVPMACSYIRQIRVAVLEEISKEYVTGLRSRGFSEFQIMVKNVLPNCVLPIITLLGLSVGSLLGGTAIIETIFSWPGIGKMAVDAITIRDYPVIQAYVIWMTIIYVGINLGVDILNLMQDPEKWHGGKKRGKKE